MLVKKGLHSQVPLSGSSQSLRYLPCKCPARPGLGRLVRFNSSNREGQGPGNVREGREEKESGRATAVKDEGEKEAVKATVKDKEDAEDDEDEEVEEEELTAEEMTTAVTLENCVRAGICTVLCALCGQFLDIDYNSAYRLSDTQDALLGVETSVALALATTALLAVQPECKVTRQTTNPSEDVLKALELAETKLDKITIVQASSLDDLNPFARGASRPEPEAMRDAPFATGLRFFQLWFTKPYLPSPQLTLGQASLLLPSSALFLAANELLLRGLFATLIARGAQGAVSQADSSSFLIWVKVFGLANEDAYRWLGAIVVGALSAWANYLAAERAQTWARALVKSKLLDKAEEYAKEWAEEDSSSDGNEGSVTEGHDASQSSSSSGNSSSRSAPEQSSSTGSTSSIGSSTSSIGSSTNSTNSTGNSTSTTSDCVPAGRADGSSSSDSGKEEHSSSSSTVGVDFSESIQAIVFNAATGKMEVVDAPTHDDEGRQLVQDDDEPTQEDEVVFKLVAAYGISQVLQVTVLYGLTGNLLATLAARVVSELYGIAVIQSSSSSSSKKGTAS